MAQGQTGRAILLLIIDAALWLGCIAGTIFVESILLKILFGLVAGFVTGRIFILGHDACHQSFTPNRELNKVLGRIAFLPSLTPYSLWDVGHNVVHHGQTNLKGFDFVWAPLSKAEFDALPAWRKALERLYRSGWGPVFYYLIEIWWRREYFPNAKNKPGDRPICNSIPFLEWHDRICGLCSPYPSFSFLVRQKIRMVEGAAFCIDHRPPHF
jgi:omega-6 fatty acid desaturase (delta-12 desaturase)